MYVCISSNLPQSSTNAGLYTVVPRDIQIILLLRLQEHVKCSVLSLQSYYNLN